MFTFRKRFPKHKISHNFLLLRNFLKSNQNVEEDVKYRQLPGIAVKEDMFLEFDVHSCSDEEEDIYFDDMIDSETTTMFKERYSDIMFDINEVDEFSGEESEFNNKNCELDDNDGASIPESNKPYQDEEREQKVTIRERKIIPKEENSESDNEQQHKTLGSDSSPSHTATVTSPFEFVEVPNVHKNHDNGMNELDTEESESTPIFKEKTTLDPDSLTKHSSPSFKHKVSTLMRTVEYSFEPEEEIEELINKYDKGSDYELSDDDENMKENGLNDEEISDLSCNFKDSEEKITDKEILYDINDEKSNLAESEKELNMNVKLDNLYVDSSRQTIVGINNILIQLYSECKDINENYTEFSFTESILKGITDSCT